jgi:2-keto-3-deoxy-L-rhamnonate aldolase RhmA
MARENNTKRKLAAGECVFGIAISELKSPVVARVFADLGYDFLFFDMEHSTYSVETVADLVWSCRTANITPIVRVPDAERFYISRALDWGAQGIIVPRVESVEQVASIVSYGRYPSLGTRGVALGGRHLDYQSPADFGETIDSLNREILLGIQIETKVAVDRVDQIVACPGIDLVMVGPADLSVSLGVPYELESPVFEGAMQKIVTTCQEHNVPVGLQSGSLDFPRKWMRRGCRYIMLGNDMLCLSLEAARRIEVVKSEIDKIERP